MKITPINPDSAIVQQKLVLVRSRGMEIRADQTPSLCAHPSNSPLRGNKAVVRYSPIWNVAR